MGRGAWGVEHGEDEDFLALAAVGCTRAASPRTVGEYA